MRYSFLALLLLAKLATAAVVPAPVGVTVGPAVQSGPPLIQYSAPLSWTNNTSATQWLIYVNGNLAYSPYVANTTLSGSQRTYTMTNLQPSGTPLAIAMRAVVPPNPASDFSATVYLTVTSDPLAVECVNCPGGTGGPVTVTGGVSITAGVAGVSVTAAQLGTWTVGVNSGVAGISVTASQGSPWTVSGSVAVTNNEGLTTTAYQGGAWTVGIGSGVAGISTTATIVGGVAGISVTASLATGTNYIGAVNVSNTAANPVSVSLPAVTNANPLPVSATVNGVYSAIKTSSSGVDALNTATVFDYDANSFTATTRRGAPTVNSYFATSGTTAVFTGYGLLYGWGMTNPSTVSGSKVTLFDGSVTRQVLTAEWAAPYTLARGMAFTTGLTVKIDGSAFDGAFWTEHTR